MTRRRRFENDPVLWIIFVLAIGAPSMELARLRAARSAPPPFGTQAPRVMPAGNPRVEATAPVPPPPIPQPRPLPAAPSAPTRPAPTLRHFLTPDRTDAPISAFVLSPDGDLAAVLEESGRVTVWNVDLRKEISSFNVDRPAPVTGYRPAPSMALMSGGRTGPFLAIVGWDGRMHVWDVVSGSKLFMSPPDAGDPERARATTPRIVDVVWTGSILATTLTFDGRLANWQVTRPEESALVSRPPSPNGGIGDIDASFDRGIVAVAGRGGVYAAVRGRVGWGLVDSSTNGATIYPVRVQLSHDGALLASAWSDASVRVYSTATGERIRGFGFGHAPSLLAFSRDNELLAVGGPGPHISVWNMAPNNDIPVHLTAPSGRPLRAMSFARQGRGLILLEEGERYLRELDVP